MPANKAEECGGFGRSSNSPFRSERKTINGISIQFFDLSLNGKKSINFVCPKSMCVFVVIPVILCFVSLWVSFHSAWWLVRWRSRPTFHRSRPFNTERHCVSWCGLGFPFSHKTRLGDFPGKTLQKIFVNEFCQIAFIHLPIWTRQVGRGEIKGSVVQVGFLFGNWTVNQDVTFSKSQLLWRLPGAGIVVCCPASGKFQFQSAQWQCCGNLWKEIHCKTGVFLKI